MMRPDPDAFALVPHQAEVDAGGQQQAVNGVYGTISVHFEYLGRLPIPSPHRGKGARRTQTDNLRHLS